MPSCLDCRGSSLHKDWRNWSGNGGLNDGPKGIEIKMAWWPAQFSLSSNRRRKPLEGLDRSHNLLSDLRPFEAVTTIQPLRPYETYMPAKLEASYKDFGSIRAQGS